MYEEEEYEEEEREEEKIKKEKVENNNKKEVKIRISENKNNDNNRNDINNEYKIDKSMLNKENINKDYNIESKESREKQDKKIALLFNRKLKNIEKLSQKVDFVLNKIELNKKVQKENRNKKIISENKILLEKEMQIKNSLAMIHSLTKENTKLKEQIEILNKKLIISDDLSLLEQISSKNEEIEQLRKKIVELTKKYNEAKNKNLGYETQINHSKGIINRYKTRIIELKTKYDNSQEVTIRPPKNLNKKGNPLIKSASHISLKKTIQNKSMHELFNENFYQLLTEKEKSSLRNLFNSNEEYIAFNSKLNIIETRNKNAEKQYENEIENLNQLVKIKDVKIENLNKEIEKRDKLIKTLESKLNELKIKNKIIIRKQKKILTIEDQLKDNGYKINNYTSNRDKLEKLNILVNHYQEELNKNYIEKCKEEEINKLNKEIGEIHFFDSKFFAKFGKKSNNK